MLYHTSSVNAAAVTLDSMKAISASDDSTLKVWNLESGRIIVEFTPDDATNSVALSLDDVTGDSG
jgi:hypothetical protein